MNKKNLKQVFLESLNNNPEKVLFRYRHQLVINSWTSEEVLFSVQKVLTFFQENDLKKGDKILLWGANSPYWSMVFLAAVMAGVVVVPVDYRSSWEIVDKYQKQTKAKALFSDGYTQTFIPDRKISFATFDLFQTVNQRLNKFDLKKLPKIEKNDQLAIFFTSGSSGNPKGVITTQANFLAQIEQVHEVLPHLDKYETVSILPLSHIYESLYGLILPVYLSGTINYLGRINPLTIKKALRRSKSTYLLVVPQFLRVLYENILEEAATQGKLKLFTRLLKIAPYFPKSIRRMMFSSVHKSFGNSLDLMTCGSAPLEPKLGEAWQAMGFTIMEGYGATETTALVSVMPYGETKFGTVGKASSKAEIKITEKNEILVKGDIISPGYYGESEKTAKVFQDGWYHTGDTGRFDEKGRLIVTGRISSRIVMPDGTKVYPEDVERKLNDNQAVRDSCLVGVKTQEADIRLQAYVLPSGSLSEIDTDRLLSKVNQKLEVREKISSLEIWPAKDFPRTKTLKVDRAQVCSMVSADDKEELEIFANSKEAVFTVKTIVESVAKKKVDEKSLQLGEDLNLDSLRRMQIAAGIEQHLGVMIDESKLTAETTVYDLEKMVKENFILKSKHSADEVIEHWRFSFLARTTRPYLQDYLYFLLHKHWVKLNITQGQKLLKNLPDQALYIFNHVGMFDIVCPLRLLPRKVRKKMAVPATNELWDTKSQLIPTLIELGICGYPFAREGSRQLASQEATAELLSRGYSLMIAPEGSMQRVPGLQEFKPGIGLLAKEYNLPVYMFKMDNNYHKVFPAPPFSTSNTDSSYFLPRADLPVNVKIGKVKINKDLEYKELADDIRQQFLDL